MKFTFTIQFEEDTTICMLGITIEKRNNNLSTDCLMIWLKTLHFI